MARVYEGIAARALGTAGGLLMFGTGAGMYVFMGATASNVPLSRCLEAAIHGAAPALEASAGQAMPLSLLVVFGPREPGARRHRPPEHRRGAAEGRFHPEGHLAGRRPAVLTSVLSTNS